MTDALRPSLYAVPFGQDICDAAVEAIFARTGEDALALSETLLLLPNNRAIKSMTEAFVRRIKPGLLLPRMAAVGDLALDEALGPILDPLDAAAHIPPAIAQMPRTLLLTRLVIADGKANGTEITPTEGLKLARYLADVIDELEVEKISFDEFMGTEPAGQDLAEHWQRSYGQLRRLIPEYQKHLQLAGLIDPASRRNLLLERLSKTYALASQKGLVVAIGISTAAPAIADLLKQVAMLNQSMVIFPSIDLEMSEADWDKLGPYEPVEGEIGKTGGQEAHPQFHLKLLLEKMGFQRSELELLGRSKVETGGIIPQIFCLPEATAEWQNLPAKSKQLPNIRFMLAEDSAEEARAISLLIRKALEDPGKRVALVTPDRELALRTAAQLKRWNINVDDSAGMPLIQTAEAMLVMALADAAAYNFAPVQLLAVLKHPLVHKEEGRIEWLDQARQLDMLLRGPNEGTGLKSISDKIAKELNKEKGEHRILAAQDCIALDQWWSDNRKIFSDLHAASKGNLADILHALQEAATILSQGAVWKGSNGRQLAAFFENLAGLDLTAIGKLQIEALPSVLAELLQGETVRPVYGRHPRVAIYGLLEARMQQADMLICGALNEGSWPQLPQPDPWLPPRIRRELQLPAPERNIGLSAHDLSSFLGAKEAVLSRAKRDRSGPTVASRFILRIQALFGDALQNENEALELARLIDKPAKLAPPYTRPAPMPSAAQRKVKLSITQFDTLKANPYSFYASKIMRLSELEAVDAEPSYAWRGTTIHRILELWHKEDDSKPEALMQRAEDLLTNTALHPALRAMWQPRIAKSLQWIAQETQRLQNEEGRKVLVAEKKGEMEIAGIEVSGRADRIDRLSDGSLAIVDYKTGSAPSAAQVFAGFALQLGLLGLMAENGKIDGVKGNAAYFEYWSLAKDNGEFGVVKKPTSDKERKNTVLSSDLVQFAEREAVAILNRWINGDEAFTALLKPEYSYGEHNQLMRLQEWDGRQALAGEAPE